RPHARELLLERASVLAKFGRAPERPVAQLPPPPPRGRALHPDAERVLRNRRPAPRALRRRRGEPGDRRGGGHAPLACAADARAAARRAARPDLPHLAPRRADRRRADPGGSPRAGGRSPSPRPPHLRPYRSSVAGHHALPPP